MSLGPRARLSFGKFLGGDAASSSRLRGAAGADRACLDSPPADVTSTARRSGSLGDRLPPTGLAGTPRSQRVAPSRSRLLPVGGGASLPGLAVAHLSSSSLGVPGMADVNSVSGGGSGYGGTVADLSNAARMQRSQSAPGIVLFSLEAAGQADLFDGGPLASTFHLRAAFTQYPSPASTSRVEGH